MKNFQFKLESVLQLRERTEAEAQQNHAAAGRRLEAAVVELAEAETEHKSLATQLGDMQRGSFRPAERDILWKALNYQKGLCTRLQQNVDLAVKDLEEKRAMLLKAQSECQAMVKLREKGKLEYSRAADSAQRAMVDDLVNSRHAAKQRFG
jgi:flagellar protein FliJ